jgi:hypothetical protein
MKESYDISNKTIKGYSVNAYKISWKIKLSPCEIKRFALSYMDFFLSYKSRKREEGRWKIL